MFCKFKRVLSYWLINIYKDTCKARISSFFYEIFSTDCKDTHSLNLCMLGNFFIFKVTRKVYFSLIFHAFLSSADFCQNQPFQKLF